MVQVIRSVPAGPRARLPFAVVTSLPGIMHMTELPSELLTKVFAGVLSQWRNCDGLDATPYQELRSYRGVCRKSKSGT